MKKYKTTYALSIAVTSLMLMSCQSLQEAEKGRTYGIRHDKNLIEYEALVTDKTRDLPDFSSVIFFAYSLDGTDNADLIASGVLINEQWILTAGHNFFVAEEQDKPALASGVKVYVGNNPNEPENIYDVSNIVFHPTWINEEQSYGNANDFSLVKLSKPITNITPATLYTDKTEPLGSIVWHAGFGGYSEVFGDNPELDSNKHAIQNTLDRVQDGLTTSINGVTYSGGLLAFDFDNPESTSNTLNDAIVNEEEAFLGKGTSDATPLEYEGTTVTGDSGGPLFVKNPKNNQWQVAGILSGGAEAPLDNHIDADYGDISFYTRVSSSYDWIKSVITQP